MTEAFLTALGLERATYQLFPDREGAPHPRILHGPYRAVRGRLEVLNREGAGVFVMVNAGDLQGRRAANVVRVSAYFADLDGTELLDEYPLLPTVVVESSPRRYHLYWHITDAPLASFGWVQKHVAALLGSDEKVHDLPRVMRLPTYLHQKAEPFVSRVLELSGASYAHETFTEAFAVPTFQPPRVSLPLPRAVQDYCDSVTGANRPSNSREGGRHALLDRVATSGPGSRNDTLFRTASALANDVAAGTLDREVMQEELAEAARMSGLDEREIAATIRSALRYA